MRHFLNQSDQKTRQNLTNSDLLARVFRYRMIAWVSDWFDSGCNWLKWLPCFGFRRTLLKHTLAHWQLFPLKDDFRAEYLQSGSAGLLKRYLIAAKHYY